MFNELRPFRFWCQKVLPLVYDDSLSYYELLCKLVHYINEMGLTVNTHTEALEFLIKTYEDFVDTLDVEKIVGDKLDEMALDGTLESLINNVLANYQGEQATMLAEKHEAVGMQGCCYIGNNQIVYYIVGSSDTGTLVCFNTSTFAEVWRYTVACEHGNTITYNKYTNSIYITGCFSVADTSVLSTNIFRIKLDSPSVIYSTIQLNRGCYSLVFNDETRKYYAICARGTTSGQANRVYVYDEAFNEESYFDLDVCPPTEYGQSWQGLCVSIDNKLYAVGYTPNSTVLCYNLEGKLLSSYKVPKVISGYKEVMEVEGLAYDFDRNLMHIGFVTTTYVNGQGIQVCFATTNILGSVIPLMLYESNNPATTIITCQNSARTTFKASLYYNKVFDLYDAVVAAKYCGGYSEIGISANPPVSGAKISGLEQCVIGGDGTYNMSSILVDYCDLQIQGVIFNGYTERSGVKANVIASNSNLSILNCTFNISEGSHGIFSRANSIVYEAGNTYNDVTKYGIIGFNGDIRGNNRKFLNISSRSGYPVSRIDLYEGTMTVGETYSFATRDVNLDSAMRISVGIQAGAREVTDFLLSTTGSTTKIYKQCFFYDSDVLYRRFIEGTFDKTNKTFTLNRSVNIAEDGTITSLANAYVCLYL